MKIIPLSLYRNDQTIKANIALVHSDDLPNKKNYLNSTEKKEYEQIKINKKKNDFLLGRYALKIVTAQYINKLKKNFTNKELAKISTKKAVLQYPLVNIANQAPPSLTLSHTNNIAIALAFSPGHDMGIDIEKHNNKRIKTYKRILSTNEILLSQNTQFNEKAYCLLWTLKESLSKALRCGFTTPFSTLEIKTLVVKNNIIESRFKNFSQYKAYSFEINDYFISITLPNKTKIDINDQREIQDLLDF